MKKMLTMLLLAVFAVFADENTQEQNSRRIGMGLSFSHENVNINTIDSYWLTNPASSIYYPSPYSKAINSLIVPTIYIPFYINEKFKIEPEFGFTLYNNDSKGLNDRITVKQWGLSIVWILPIDKMSILLGGRVRSQFIENKYSFDESSFPLTASSYMPSEFPDMSQKQSNLEMGPFIGCEIMLQKHFHIAGTVRLNYSKLGKWNKDVFDKDDHVFKIQPMIIFYWTI